MAGARGRARCPPTGWRSRFDFDPAQAATSAAPRLRAHGALAARFARARAIERLLPGAAAGPRPSARHLHGDASVARLRAADRDRRRRRDPDDLAAAPPRPDRCASASPIREIARLSLDIRAFLAMAEGLRAPGLFDAGDLRPQRRRRAGAHRGFRRRDDRRPARRRSRSAMRRRWRCSPSCTRAICPASSRRRRDLHDPVYDIEAMLIEVELALDWYAPAFASGAPSSGARMQFLGLWREALAPLLAEPKTWTLRDFHSPNLHWLARARRAEAARARSISRTRSSGRRPTTSPRCCRMRASTSPTSWSCGCWRFMRAAGQARSRFRRRAAFAASYAVMGAQRATKILGMFTRLDRRDGKPQYLAHAAAHRARRWRRISPIRLLQPLRRWFETLLPRALGEAARTGALTSLIDGRPRRCREPPWCSPPGLGARMRPITADAARSRWSRSRARR